MGALPKQRYSQARQGKHRAHLHLTVPQLVVCPECSNKKRPHRVCPSCGFYKGQPVIEVKQRTPRPQA